MKIKLAAVSPIRSRPKSTPADELASTYLARATRFNGIESEFFSSEAALLAAFDPARHPSRTRPTLILFDRLGTPLSSEQFATRLGTLRDSGAQTVVLAVGPADGWSAQARARANLLISFGPITLPHELARVVLAEQTYRALTILAGHPYHSGH
jgi:23S rRNA (pseudouridine1915-N3)-methyltransferase